MKLILRLSFKMDFFLYIPVRDPSQVFTLLESIYCAFDSVASRRNVFKVETIGDCYVAGTFFLSVLLETILSNSNFFDGFATNEKLPACRKLVETMLRSWHDSRMISYER